MQVFSLPEMTIYLDNQHYLLEKQRRCKGKLLRIMKGEARVDECCENAHIIGDPGFHLHNFGGKDIQ